MKYEYYPLQRLVRIYQKMIKKEDLTVCKSQNKVAVVCKSLNKVVVTVFFVINTARTVCRFSHVTKQLLCY